MRGHQKLVMLVPCSVLILSLAIFLSGRPSSRNSSPVSGSQKRSTVQSSNETGGPVSTPTDSNPIQGKEVSDVTDGLNELRDLLKNEFDQDSLIRTLRRLQLSFTKSQLHPKEIAQHIAGYNEIIRSLALIAWQRAAPGEQHEHFRTFAKQDGSGIVRLIAVQAMIWGRTPFMQIDDSDPFTDKDTAGWPILLHAIIDLVDDSCEDVTKGFAKRWTSLPHDEDHYVEPFRKPTSPLDDDTVGSIIAALRLEIMAARKRILLSSLSRNVTASSVTNLIEEFITSEDSAAREAVKLAGEGPTGLAVPILSRAINSHSSAVVEASVYELGRHMSSEVGTMLSAAYWRHANPDVRRAILVVVTDSKSGVGTEFLTEVFSRETEISVLTAAVRHAPNVAGASVLKDEIRKLLEHPDSAVRAQAKYTLERLQ